MYRCVPIASLVFTVVACIAGRAIAQSDPPVVRSTAVTSIATPISIDGVLSENAWSSAPKIGDLIQRQPDTGQPPTERTDITLLRDADNLYIGVHRVRLRTLSRRRHADGARWRARVGRSHRDRARHISRPAKRVLLCDQSRRRARRRARVRERAVEHGVGRDLACPDDDDEHRVDRRVCHSLQEPQLSGRGQRVGIQHRSHDLAQARGRSLVGRATAHAVSSGIGSRRNHEPGRA